MFRLVTQKPQPEQCEPRVRTTADSELEHQVIVGSGLRAIGIRALQIVQSPDHQVSRCFEAQIENEIMANEIPSVIQGQKYISLTTFRKSGVGVATPVWFGEDAGKLYVMTRSDMGKTKRIRNNSQVTVAPCTIRGKVTGPVSKAVARILGSEDQAHARQLINAKYWAARIPLIWMRTDTYIEISFP
jgi:PPOX class probable F420-dependent enzyme